MRLPTFTVILYDINIHMAGEGSTSPSLLLERHVGSRRDLALHGSQDWLTLFLSPIKSSYYNTSVEASEGRKSGLPRVVVV